MGKTQLQDGNLYHFTTLMDHSPQDIRRYLSEIKWLREEFEVRFQDFRKSSINFSIFADPFGLDASIFPEYLQMEVVELKFRTELKVVFCDVPSITFYERYLPPNDFPLLIKYAKMMACLFGSTDICEQLFSLMKLTKNKSVLI